MSRKENFYLFLFFLLPLFFLSGTLTSGRTFFARDLTYLFHPWRVLSSQMLQGGTMPLWNPYEMGGMPFLANCQSAVLYPFTILFSLFGFVPALKIFHWLHYALAALGFYLLGRRLAFSPWPSFLAGVLFAFNGYSLTRLEFLSAIGTLIWLPWLLIFALEGSAASFFPRSTAAACVLSLSLFAGFPQILLIQIAAALFLSFLLLPRRETFLFWSSAALLSLFLAAPQWLPTWELMGRSIRSGGGVPLFESAMYSFPLYNLPGLLIPHLLTGHVDQFTQEKFFWIWSGWWGVAATLLALLACRGENKKLIGAACLLAAAGLLWSLGDLTPFFEWVYKRFSPARLFRYPPVLLYATVTGVVFLLLCGAQTLSRRGRGALAFGLAAGLCLILELGFYARGLLPTIEPDYFHFTFHAVDSIQKDHPGTAILSPRINRVRRLRGATVEDAKIKFRGYLYDLTNLPYRIRTIVPSGEPLALHSYDRLYTHLMEVKSFSASRQLLNLWNVTHLLTDKALDPSWRLFLDDHYLKVYRNPEAFGEAFAAEKEESGAGELRREKLHVPSELRAENGRIEARFDLPKESLVVFNSPYYPGWQLFCAHCPLCGPAALASFEAFEFFHSSLLPAGAHRLTLVYRPGSWRLAVTLAILAALTLTLRAFKGLRAGRSLPPLSGGKQA